MRISTAQFHLSNLNTMLQKQTDLMVTQQQIATGERIVNASEDPVATVQLSQLERALKQQEQYKKNIDAVNNRLVLQEQVLADSQGLIQNIRELAIQGINASQTNSTRASIAVQVRQYLSDSLQLANTKDSQNYYLFSGGKSLVMPFHNTNETYHYLGGYDTRSIAIDEKRYINDVDSGAEVFMQIQQGNGTFSIDPNVLNQGAGLIGQTQILDHTLYDNEIYRVHFNTPNTFSILNERGAVVDDNGHMLEDLVYTPNAQISFKGLSFSLSGTVGNQDEFIIQPSGVTNIFSAIESLAIALETQAHNENEQAIQKHAINQSIQSLDHSLDQLTYIRTQAGAKLSTLDRHQQFNADKQLNITELKSDLVAVDMAEAITRYNQQLTGLDAAQQTYTRMQELSLFKYL